MCCMYELEHICRLLHATDVSLVAKCYYKFGLEGQKESGTAFNKASVSTRSFQQQPSRLSCTPASVLPYRHPIHRVGMKVLRED